MDIHLNFKVFSVESCCVDCRTISKTYFQILVGGLVTDQSWLVFVFVLMSTVTCA